MKSIQYYESIFLSACWQGQQIALAQVVNAAYEEAYKAVFNSAPAAASKINWLKFQ